MASRLGNQFFRYAFARALQIKFYPDYKIIIVLWAFRNFTPEQGKEGWENSLQYFNIKDAVYIEKLPTQLGAFIKYCFHKARKYIFSDKLFFKRIDARFLQPISNFFGLYNPLFVSDYVKFYRSRSKSILCNACFENYRYFNDIRQTLLEEFTPKLELLPHNRDLMNEIENSESVCVTIRRGDFLTPKYSPCFNVCDEQYFITAMKAIRAEIPDCKFFVFSDDIEDVKANIHFPFEVKYECGKDPVWEKLRLMYSCKHFIISNSTFSWWAQYLGRNENKIVYAPKPWRWTHEKCEGFYMPYMRTIECHKNK